MISILQILLEPEFISLTVTFFINVDDFQLLVGHYIIKTENGATR